MVVFPKLEHNFRRESVLNHIYASEMIISISHSCAKRYHIQDVKGRSSRLDDDLSILKVPPYCDFTRSVASYFLLKVLKYKLCHFFQFVH